MAKKKTIGRNSRTPHPGRGNLVPIALRLAPGLIQAVDVCASRAGVSRSWLVEIYLKQGAGLSLDPVEAAVKEKASEQPNLFA